MTSFRFILRQAAFALWLPAGLFAHGLENPEGGVPRSAGNHSHTGSPPVWVDVFKAFSPGVSLQVAEKEVRVESSGMPEHRMMVGIRSWQQQVPLPQPYRGRNAWTLPRVPVPAESPLSARDHFFRGAIALAANGVPIFNPIKNDGRTDTFLAGELDEFGGHCGRADDYHYHIAPLHLQERVGPGRPIAVALDGYPIHGTTEPDGSTPTGLDAFNGHETATLGYHYHASLRYPYVNGGFHGRVTEVDGQVDPQPRAVGPRPAQPPLRGAQITGFERQSGGRFLLLYEVQRQTHRLSYGTLPTGGVRFEWVDPSGRTNRAEYPAPGSGRGGDDREQDPSKAGRDTLGRQPWLRVHFQELDVDRDGVLVRSELESAADQAFRGFDRDGDGRLSREERGGKPPSAALAGFIGQHGDEIDADQDDVLRREEVDAVVLRMFRKMDFDGDGRISTEERERPLEPGRRAGPGRGGGPGKGPR